jgi:flagellar motility protein MotE (MotC chaperone)
MKKTQIIMLIAAGLLSFSASFGVSWFKQNRAVPLDLPTEMESASGLPRPSAANARESFSYAGGGRGDDAAEPLGMTERQLQHLIYDIREKMREYNTRQKELDEEAKRIQIARQSLEQDVEQLNQLREKLDTTLAALKEKEINIQNTLIAIDEVERGNLQRLATTYDRMDPEQAGKIMMSMAAGNQLQDVVKILYYMNDRNAARVLGAISATRPDVAGVLSLQLKRVQEGG